MNMRRADFLINVLRHGRPLRKFLAGIPADHRNSRPVEVAAQLLRQHQRLITAVFLFKQRRLAVGVGIRAESIICLDHDLLHTVPVQVTGPDCGHSHTKLPRLDQIPVPEFNPVCTLLIRCNVFPVNTV